jgi:peptidoglycan hydrolase CwlO-like protein
MTNDDSTQRILDALVRLEDGQAGIRADQASLRDDQASIRADQTSLRDDQASIRADQASIRADQASLRDGQTSIRADQASLRDGQTSLRAEFLAELGNTRSAIMNRVDRLENRITEIHGDMEVAMGSTEAAQRVNDNTRADLRTLGEQMSVMWKQIKRLESQVRDITGNP